MPKHGSIAYPPYQHDGAREGCKLSPCGQGTEWTDPGHGATFIELLAATQSIDEWKTKPSVIAARVALIRTCFGDCLPGDQRPTDSWERTNLRLTGAPLTAEDLKRIAEAK